MEALTPLPQIVAKRQDIAQVKTGAPEEGTFDWIFNFFSNVGSLFSGQDPEQLYDKVTHLPTTADVDTFVRYVGNMQVELNEAPALTLDRVEVRADCMRRLGVMGLMEDHAKAWMKEHVEYEFAAVNLTFQQVQVLRKKVMAAVPSVGEYTVPDAPALDASSSISKVSPGITNGGNNCYLISLLQGLIGDPITRRWIIDAEFVHDSPLLDNSGKKIRNFVKVLKECTFEFEEAQRLGRKDPLPFIVKLRTALDPLVTSINLSSGRQEDPSEVLVAILSYLNPEGNPLFNIVTEKLVFAVEDAQAKKLEAGLQALATFRAAIATLKDEDVDHAGVEVGLMAYLTYLDPVENYAALVEDASGILKAILLKLNQRTEESFTDDKALQLHLAKIDRITSEGSLPKLIEQVEKLADSLQNTPELVAKEWVKEKPTGREGLRTLKINGSTASNAFESFIAAAFNEEISKDKTGAPGISVQYLDKTPHEVRLPATHSRYAFKTTPAHVFFALNRNAHSGNRSSAGSSKEMKKVHLGETFFLHPKFTEDGQGGQYQVRWLCVHEGTGDKGGHYVNYRLTVQGWCCLNDGSSRLVDEETIEKALQDCCLIFATRMNQVLSEKQIQEGIEAAIEASHGKDNELRYNEINRAPQSHDTRELDLLHLFSNELSRKAPNVELLKKIFASLEETEFPAFVRDILTLTKNLTGAPIQNQLLQLKAIRDRLLMVELNDHIVAQYVEVREQRRRHALDAIALKDITEPSLRAAGERAEKIFDALTYENHCLRYILDQDELNGATSLFLLRTLSSSLAAKYKAHVRSSEERLPIAQYLQQLGLRNEPHIKSADELIGMIRELGIKITIQANELTAAVKAEVPILPPRRVIQRGRERSNSVSLPGKHEGPTPKTPERKRRNSLPLSFSDGPKITFSKL